jgi:hypothetical protein
MSTLGGDEERRFVAGTVRVSLAALLALGCALVVMSWSVGTALAAKAPSWTPSVKFDPAAGTTHPVTGLSCTASGFCLAVDSAGRTFTWTGSWHAAPGISRSVQFVVGLSCVSSSFCVAIGSEGKPASSSSYAVTWDGARWEAPVRLYHGSGEAALYGTVKSVWCTSESFCIAVGAQVGSVVFNGSRWVSHAGSTSGGAPPASLHFQFIHADGAFMKPWVMPHNRPPQAGTDGMGGAKCACRCRGVPLDGGDDRACGGDRRRRSDGDDAGG